MADRENVIKGLKCLITDGVPCNGCPYYGRGYCIKNIASDALDLLKEQEATIDILVKDITFHNCNNCNRKDCESKPNVGQPVRSNCIYWLEGR